MNKTLRINVDAPSPSKKKKKKKNDRTLHTSSEPEIEKPSEDPNDVSICDAETQCGNEHTPNDNDNDVHVDAQPDNDVEIEPDVDLDNPPPKKKRYDKRDFIARKHEKEREPWVWKPIIGVRTGISWVGGPNCGSWIDSLTRDDFTQVLVL